MKIKFLPHDPRAGTVAEMDSSRGRQLVEQGAAVEVTGREEAAPTTPTTPAPARKRKGK